MGGMKRCGGCGVPSAIGKDYGWEPGGVIRGKRDPDLRLVIYEPEAVNLAFKAVEELIGMPVDHLIIESRRRWTKKTQEAAFPLWFRKGVHFATDHLTGDNLLGRTIGRPITAFLKTLNIKVNNMGRAMGFGNISLGSLWEKGVKYPHRENVIHNPYSLPLYMGDNLGATEGWEFRDMQNRYEQTSSNTYRVTTFEAEHLVELQSRLQPKRFPIKPGDISYVRCTKWGTPQEVARFQWDEAGGTVTDPNLGRRVVFTDPHSLEAVFDDLVAELGEEIRDAVVKSQRRHFKSNEIHGSLHWNEPPQLKGVLALRGFGILVLLESDRHGLHAIIENGSLHLMLASMLQALLELSSGNDASELSWAFKEDGDLEISVSA